MTEPTCCWCRATCSGDTTVEVVIDNAKLGELPVCDDNPACHKPVVG